MSSLCALSVMTRSTCWHCQPMVKPDHVVGYRAAPAHSQKTLADFWHPRRRLTDLLLILNVGAFGLQYYSKGALLNWGVKVLLQTRMHLELATFTCCWCTYQHQWAVRACHSHAARFACR